MSIFNSLTTRDKQLLKMIVKYLESEHTNMKVPLRPTPTTENSRQLLVRLEKNIPLNISKGEEDAEPHLLKISVSEALWCEKKRRGLPHYFTLKL